MSERLVITPANYVPVEALAFGAVGGPATPVGPDNPLPVHLATPAAASTPLTGIAALSGTFGPFAPVPGRPINLHLSGSWAGVVTLMRSTDGGVTRHGLTLAGQPWGVFGANCCEPVWEESETGATFWLDLVLAEGTLTYRVSQ